MRSIKKILMDRDGMSPEDADSLISDAKRDMDSRLSEGEMPYDICEEWFGLEPDYIFELI